MSPEVFELVCIAVGGVYMAYTARRASHAAATNRVAGFILNPCFYLSGYAFLYLLLGSLISQAGQELYGFGFSEETRSLSNALMLYYFLVFFAVYAASDDKVLVCVRTVPIRSLALVRLLGIACVLIAISILLAHGPALLRLSANRNEVYAYFVEHIFYTFRYGTLINFSILFFVCEYLADRREGGSPLRPALIAFLPFLVIELALGGRAALLKIFLAVFVATCLKHNRLYFRYLLYAFLALAGIGLVQRFDLGAMDIGETVLSALGELILTRTTTDLIIENSIAGDGAGYFVTAVLSLFPGVLNASLFPDAVNYMDTVTSVAGREFGVGGNIVSEAYFYGGVGFAVASPLVIGSAMYLLNAASFTRRVPGFLFLLFVILGLQNMMRSSFYDQFPSYVYLMCSYFLFITLLESRGTLLRARRPTRGRGAAAAAR